MPKVDTKMILPKGIRLRGNSFAVQTRKRVSANGTSKIVSHYTSVPIRLPKGYTDEDYNVAFNEALEEAKRHKMLAIQHVATNGVHSFMNTNRRIVAVGKLKEVLDILLEKRWKDTPQERMVKVYFNDILEYFPNDIRLDDMQTDEHYEGFCSWLEKKIAERPMNNLSTVSTRSVNKRLGILRCVFNYALDKRLITKDKMLSPNPNVKNHGWKNLPVRKIRDKHVLSKAEELMVIDKANADGDHIFADGFAWLVDLGMRYETEFQKFTYKDIDYRGNTICFYRNKTDMWSPNIPLSSRWQEIAKRYREVAMSRKDGRMFAGLTKAKIRSRFEKYGRELKIKAFTPYITRRTFCTRLAERGVQGKIISTLAGHRCVETAQIYYVKPTKVILKRAIKSMEMTDAEYDGEDIPQLGHNSKNRIE